MKINRESIAIKGIERTIIDEAFENGWVAPKVPSRRRDEKWQSLEAVQQD